MPVTREEEEEFEKNNYMLNQIKSNLEALEKQREMFSCFVNAKSVDVDKVVVGIGGDIFVEKSVPEAKEVLDTRLKMINENAQKITANLQELETKAQQLNQRNQEIYEKAQGGAGGHVHDETCNHD